MIMILCTIGIEEYYYKFAKNGRKVGVTASREGGDVTLLKFKRRNLRDGYIIQQL